MLARMRIQREAKGMMVTKSLVKAMEGGGIPEEDVFQRKRGGKLYVTPRGADDVKYLGLNRWARDFILRKGRTVMVYYPPGVKRPRNLETEFMGENLRGVSDAVLVGISNNSRRIRVRGGGDRDFLERYGYRIRMDSKRKLVGVWEKKKRRH